MKKVLMITYYWPPAGGIAVQRVVKFCKYLPQLGWQPVILTVGNGSYLHHDQSHVKDIQQIESVYYARALEPHRLYESIRPKSGQQLTSTETTRSKHLSKLAALLADFIRINFFLPDARIGWYPAAIRLGKHILESEKPDLIFSTAPPFTSHLVGKCLHKYSGIPWIADFRDAWLENNLYDKPYRLPPARIVSKCLERSVLNSADRVVCISRNMKKLLSSKLPLEQQGKFRVITNGYDHENIQQRISNPDFFYISYYGTLYRQRLPEVLFYSIRQLIEKDSNFRRDFRFRVFGDIDDRGHTYLLENMPEESLIIQKPIAYQAFLAELQTPQLLLLTIDQVPYNELIITGKIFDYLTSGNSILGIGPVDGDAANILDNTKAGKMFDYSDTGIRNYIIDKYQAWSAGTLKNIQQRYPEYEREQLASDLARLFDSVSA